MAGSQAPPPGRLLRRAQAGAQHCGRAAFLSTIQPLAAKWKRRAEIFGSITHCCHEVWSVAVLTAAWQLLFWRHAPAQPAADRDFA